MAKKESCPNCGSVEGKKKAEFGYPPVCIGEPGKNATCYTCGCTFFIETGKIMVKKNEKGEVVWYPDEHKLPQLITNI